MTGAWVVEVMVVRCDLGLRTAEQAGYGVERVVESWLLLRRRPSFPPCQI